MVKFKFYCEGHENVLSTHRNTSEFTIHDHLTKRGDCIVAVKATDIPKAFSGKIRISMKSGMLKDSIIADAYEGFTNRHEMIIRKSNFTDQRTFAINADKAAVDLDRNLIKALQNKDAKLKVTIENI